MTCELKLTLALAPVTFGLNPLVNNHWSHCTLSEKYTFIKQNTRKVNQALFMQAVSPLYARITGINASAVGGKSLDFVRSTHSKNKKSMWVLLAKIFSWLYYRITVCHILKVMSDGYATGIS
jgi:hypothetical protein